MLDLDGTLYVSGRILPGALRFVARLQRAGLPFVCLTNNSSTRGSAYVEKLRSFGLDVGSAHIITSGQATITYLMHETAHRSAYVVGTPELRGEFQDAGILLDEGDPDCLVVGYDTTLDYHKLCVATRLLMDGKPYFATHPDRTCITANGLLPDIAVTIAGLEAVTGRSPKILGKPHKEMVEAAADRLRLSFADIAMVGDQLDTDIAMAVNHGLLGVLVLSGESDLADVTNAEAQPDLVVQDIGELDRLFDEALP